MQQSEMLLYALNLGFFILGFAIYPVAYGVGFTLQGLPIVTWISNFKQQTIVGGLYFNVPKPSEFWIDQGLRFPLARSPTASQNQLGRVKAIC